MATNYFLNQYFSTFLNVGGGIDASQTTGIIVQAVSGLDITKPGIACFSYSDPIDTSLAEWITYTSINGSNELQGVTRGAEGFAAKSHSNQAVVVFPLSESHINTLATALSIGGVATNGVTTTLDEDDMATNSATALATQQSIKAYVGTSTSTASSATPTPTGDRKVNELYITALALASELQAPSGTPVNGNKLIVRIKDDGTARALTYNAIYRAIGITLPTTTTISKTTYIEAIYNSADSKWDCIITLTQDASSSSALSSKTGTFTRDLTTASGDVSYTGVGFIPTSIHLAGIVSSICQTVGFCDSGKVEQCTFSAMSAAYTQGGVSPNVALLVTAGSAFQVAQVKSFDADGFTLTWSKTGSPTGTGEFVYIAHK